MCSVSHARVLTSAEAIFLMEAMKKKHEQMEVERKRGPKTRNKGKNMKNKGKRTRKREGSYSNRKKEDTGKERSTERKKC